MTVWSDFQAALEAAFLTPADREQRPLDVADAVANNAGAGMFALSTDFHYQAKGLGTVNHTSPFGGR